MVINRSDTVIRISRWLDDAIGGYISEKKVRVEFPSKRNFVDKAVLRFLEEREVKIK